MVYIAGRRNVDRVKPLVDVQVFSNVERSEIDCEWTSVWKDETGRIESLFVQGRFPLRKGSNEIEVRAGDGKKTINRSMHLILQ